MFKSARLKLTTWYLLIIMTVSLAFSLVIYGVQANELDRFSRLEQLRFSRRLPFTTPQITIITPDQEIIQEAKERLALRLVLINAGIFIFAGASAYFLAGRTLSPIGEMLEEQNRFIGDASHELRTPLTSLRSAIEVHLRDKHPTAHQTRSLLADSLGEVQKMQILSEDLLKLAQFQTNHRPKNFQELVLSDIVSSAVRKVHSFALKRKIKISQKVDSARVRGDREALTDLMVILLDNAIKYSHLKGNVTVGARKVDGWAEMFVRDEGIGIEEKDMAHVFDRFYRADAARSKSGTGGYGLGLAIAKKIVDEHRGTISVESLPGQETIFTVRLPVWKI